MNATSAVDYVFSALAATYGSAWDRALGSAPIADVKTVWCDALSDFMHSDDAKRAIVWGLKNLPDTVPNARQFRTLCRQAPAKAQVMLPSPKADPVIVKKVVEGIKKPSSNPHGMKAWAYQLRAMEAGGYKLSRYQKMSVNAAIGGAA